MKQGDTLLIKLVSMQGLPFHLDNVFLSIGFFTNAQYRYGFWLGATNRDGELFTGYDDIEKQRLDSATESIMDFNTSLNECDAMVKIMIPSKEELLRSYEVATRWAGHGKTPAYAVGWLTSNNGRIKADDKFVNLTEGETLVALPCEFAVEE